VNQRQEVPRGSPAGRSARRIDTHGDDLPYLQVLRRLEADIATGRLAHGERLASERDLGARLGVARNTLRRALADLEARGLVASRGRHGWLVTASLTERVEGPQGLTDWAGRHGFAVSSVVRANRVRASDDAEALRLRIAPGTPVFELERIRLLDRLPISLDRSVLHPRLAEIVEGVDFSSASLYGTLRTRARVLPSRAEVVLRAISADVATAALLEVGAATALLELSETVFDQYGEPFETAILLNRGDRYAFGTTLSAQARERVVLGSD
jgi:DNA-binding GntR family transcriptional regulator